MSLNIRKIEASDFTAWQELWRSYLEFYEASVTEDVYQCTFNRLIDSERPQQNGLIALQDNQPIGLVHFIYHPHNWRIEDVCYLQDLYATPSVRGSGVGRALIEAVYTEADMNGTPTVYWNTQEFNETARKLYDRIANVTPFIKYQR